jgi:integrase
MAKLLLTKGVLDTLACPEEAKKRAVFDLGCRGLMVELRPTGRKTYYLRYIDERGAQRQYKIGDSRDISLDAARRMADRLRARIVDGQNPAQARVEARQTPKLRDFIEKTYLPFIRSYKRSWETDVSLLNNHVLPAFGARYMDLVTKHDVQTFLFKKRETHKPATVNRILIVLRFVYNQAMKWETPGVHANPAMGARLFQENNKKERYLSVDEAQRLYDAVCQSENPLLKFIIPLLTLTGARKREALDARWRDFDLTRRIWTVPITKSGQARHVPLSDGAIAILQQIPRQPLCDFVFPNPQTAKPYGSIFNAWNTARIRAGISDVRMHDLRHSFASLLVNQGRTLYEVQKILGHSQIKTTQRYAHLANATLVEAANAASRIVGAAMGTAIEANVNI